MTQDATNDPLAQPKDSKIVFAADGDSLTFMVPRTGFRGAALFFLVFALFWDSITFCVVGGFALSAMKHPDIGDILALLFLLFFVAIGVAMAVASVQMAFRRAVILATRQSLVYTQTGPIRNAEFQWKPGEILSIAADYSGTKINNRRLKELQVRDMAGKKRGFMDGRDDAELEWIAANLRAFYDLRLTRENEGQADQATAGA